MIFYNRIRLFSFIKEGARMGKDLRGKEIGAGLSQRKDGRYSARFTSRTGKRIEKYFDKISEAKKWLAEAKYNDEHGEIGASSKMTVDAWFSYWIENIKKGTVRPNTIRNYSERYKANIQKCIGSMIISEVKPMHCQNIFNVMNEEDYAGSTMYQTRITLVNMFSAAKENRIIKNSPVTKSVKCPKKVEVRTRVLSLEEQKAFLDVARNTTNFRQYMLILNTGIRTGELVGLKWEDIDFENRTISINRSMEFRYTDDDYKIGPPKSDHGYRTIPMTQVVYDILKSLEEDKRKRKVVNIRFNDFVFVNRKGTPTKNSTYDSHLYKLAEKAGIESFSMHTLRHTFATRCIENGMRPKTLQKLLGHAKISITMDRYVHVTDDEKEKEMRKIENIYDGVKLA